MALQCNHCGEIYLSNHALYKHKSLTHPKSSVLSDEASLSYPVKRSAEVDEKELSKYRKTNPTTFPQTSVVETFDAPQEKLTDLVSRPELLSIASPDHSISQNQIRDLVAPKNSNRILESYEMSDFKRGVKEDQTKVDWYKRKLSNLQIELREKCDEINRIQKHHQKQIVELKAAHMKEINRLEEEWAVEIKYLNNQIQVLKDGEGDTGDLTKAIFNVSAIREIIEIQRLIKNHQINEVLQDHLPTFKNMLLSLSSGVLPLCQPQRSKVTNKQRMLVEQLQSATRSSAAKRILRDKEVEIISLFEIVKHSLKLAVSSFNHFSTL